MNKTLAQRCFIFLGPHVMNRLPVMLKNAENGKRNPNSIKKTFEENEL